MNKGTRMKARVVTRRGMLKSVAATVAGLSIVPSRVLGGAGNTSPGERINMGFIGVGNQGGGHLMGGAWTYLRGGFLAREDVQVRAVCDVLLDRREKARIRCNQVYAERFGKPSYDDVKAFNDFRELLAMPEIDAVLLALPFQWHGIMSAMAARAGKDVYCEKPMFISVREGRVMADAFRRFGRIYQAGTQQRSSYEGKFRRACELVRNGRIGELKEVYAYRLPGAFFPTSWNSRESKPVPEGLDWDLWLGPLPARPYGGNMLQELFVGDLNWSPHHYDFICWTLGAALDQPFEIEWQPDGIHYHLPNGVVIHSGAHPGEPFGGEGGACFVGTEGRIAVDRNGIVSTPARILRESLRPGDQRVYYATSHSENFLECIRSRRATICDPETAFRSMSTILAGGIALALRRSLRWDPGKETFIGDDEANRLLSHTPRSPWRF